LRHSGLTVTVYARAASPLRFQPRST
jgi:hypothetical protein